MNSNIESAKQTAPPRDDHQLGVEPSPNFQPDGDQHVTLLSLRQQVATFVTERQWEKFHNPKNVAMSVAIEAAELMEHFQWLTLDEAQADRLSAEQRQAIAEEMSDVFCYLMALSNTLDIDMSTAFRNKMIKNRQKYPAAEFQGNYRRQ